MIIPTPNRWLGLGDPALYCLLGIIDMPALSPSLFKLDPNREFCL